MVYSCGFQVLYATSWVIPFFMSLRIHLGDTFWCWLPHVFRLGCKNSTPFKAFLSVGDNSDISNLFRNVALKFSHHFPPFLKNPPFSHCSSICSTKIEAVYPTIFHGSVLHPKRCLGKHRISGPGFFFAAIRRFGRFFLQDITRMSHNRT